MRQTMEDGVSEVLSCVVEDVGQAVHGNVSGAQLLHELLSAPWLNALLKMYECLLQFQRLKPSPFLPYSSGLSHEIMNVMSRIHRPSAEARELYGLLCSPHIKALLSSHDSVAQADFGPVLAPMPDDLPEDEEAMRIVCLVKNNQPLNGEVRRGSVGSRVGVIQTQWSSLRRLTVERLDPARRAWSGEELSAPESEARLLPVHRRDPNLPFLPRYQSTGSCCACPRTAAVWNRGLNQSAPSVFSPAPYSEPPKQNDGAFLGDSSDDYSFPPPPVPAYSVSLPNSPALYKKTAAGGHCRTIPTPGRPPSCSVPCSPATQRSTRHQGVSTLPAQGRQHGRLMGSQIGLREDLRSQAKTKPQVHQRATLTKQQSIDELRSAVQTVASSIEYTTEDVRHLGHKMVAATELMTDNVEENAQALNLLVEVVDKLQGLIVASKNQTLSPPGRVKQRTPPQPPKRVSSLSPKIVRKAPSFRQRPLSTSSSSSSCSSSSSSVHFCPDAFVASNRMNRDAKKTVSFSSAPKTDGNRNGQVRLNNGTVPRVPSSDQYDCNTTGCLTTKKKKKKK